MSREHPCRIRAVPPEHQLAALALLHEDWPADTRRNRVAETWQAVRDDPLRSHLWGAFEAERLVGCVWAQRMPGKTALVWGPATVPGADPHTADQLLGSMLSQIDPGEIHVAQTVVAPGDHKSETRLARHGFLPPVELLYFASTTARAVEVGWNVDFEPYREDQRARLASLIETTYSDTLDVPQLNGARQMDDIVDGYGQTGVFHPSHWLFVRQEGADVGCLLLADHPQLDQVELVYMGIIPEFRRRGIGAQLVRRAMQARHALNRTTLLVAVDAANTPALRLYRRSGLVELDRRRISIKILKRER